MDTFRDRFNRFQGNPHVHPLTCGVSSSHGPLDLDPLDERMYCTAPGCDYTQPLDDRLRAIVEAMHDTDRATP